jgi:hypothetical protein
MGGKWGDYLLEVLSFDLLRDLNRWIAIRRVLLPYYSHNMLHRKSRLVEFSGLVTGPRCSTTRRTCEFVLTIYE